MQKNVYIPIDIQIKNIVECTQLVKRGDTLTLIIKVFNNAVLADLTSQSVDLILKKSDGKLIEKTITSVSNGVITATLDVQATNVAGIVQGEVQIYTSDTLSSTNTFTFNVDSSLADDVLEASQDDIEVLADLKNTITDGNAAIDKYKTNVEAITGTAGAVEALANIKNYIDSNLDELEQANTQATVNITNETGKNTQATKNIADLTELNSQAVTLEQNLQTLTSENNQATNNISSLNTENANATQNITDLTTRNSNAETNKTNLDSANTQAEANIQALEALGDVTEVAQDVTNIKNEVETARGTYNNLDARLDADESNITSNLNKIGDLSANGLTEANLATAIKNDRAQLSEIVKKNSDFIPLAIESGYTYNANQNYYTKNFDNSVEAFFSIAKADGFAGNIWTTLAKLPVGFLPNEIIYGTGECNGYPTSIRVQATGEIQFFVINGGNIGYNNVRGYIRFYLTGGVN